jgi:AAA domain
MSEPSGFINMEDAVTEQEGATKPGRLIISLADFLKGFVPPDYILDGILQRRFIYSLTGQTGHAKTAIALLIARLMSSASPDAMLGAHRVEKGRVIYFVGENADDIRARIIGAEAHDLERDCLSFIVGRYSIATIYDQVTLEMQALGGADLIIIDTSAAYFFGNEELSNTQMGDHARTLRTLTQLPGGPCVVVLCHPVKYVTHPSQLLPRGGGAFLNEMDGNLTAWRHDDDLVELHHSSDKWRGPGFEPISFKVKRITTPKLVDRKGREIPTVKVVTISEAEEAAQGNKMRADEDRLLLELLTNGERSHADLARACKFFFEDGAPAKSRLQRTLKRLEQANPKLAKLNRGHFVLTDEGRKLAKKLKEAEEEGRIEDRGAAVSGKAFFAVRGKRLSRTVPCIRCGKADGEVFKIKDGRLDIKGHAEALHEGCAMAWFTGQECPPEAMQQAEMRLDGEPK